MKKQNKKAKSGEPDMRANYDFNKGVRGKYYDAVRAGILKTADAARSESPRAKSRSRD